MSEDKGSDQIPRPSSDDLQEAIKILTDFNNETGFIDELLSPFAVRENGEPNYVAWLQSEHASVRALGEIAFTNEWTAMSKELQALYSGRRQPNSEPPTGTTVAPTRKSWPGKIIDLARQEFPKYRDTWKTAGEIADEIAREYTFRGKRETLRRHISDLMNGKI